jgi:alginate O-acetyltransferase complex protein AlgI
MEFSTIQFLSYLLLSIFFYFLINHKWKWIVLLIVSFIFIYSYSLHFLIYTVAYAIFNYLIAIAISKSPNGKSGRIIYLIGIFVNIGMLVFYKYTNFLLENLFNLIRITGIEVKIPVFEILVPLGISFYTFQSIGYLIDIKRGTKPVEKHIGKFVLFITYFPKFISGPVERSSTLLPELNKDYSFDKKIFNDGLMQLLWGFFKTTIVANRLEIIVNGVYNDLFNISGSVLLINYFIEFIFLYFNFSGYTDIVLGISKLFGIKLSINFERPLFATNVANYWRRWHISLTSWCNDYIFRRVILRRMKWKKWASVYGVFLTFIVIGVWHGADWNFVLLGLMQGIAINYEFFTKKIRLKYGNGIPLWLNLFVSRLLTFIFICFSIVFFFSKDMKEVSYYFSNIFKGGDLKIFISDLGITLIDLVLVTIGIIIVLLSEYRDEKGKSSIKAMILNNKFIFWIVILGTILILMTFGLVSETGSLYKQF